MPTVTKRRIANLMAKTHVTISTKMQLAIVLIGSAGGIQMQINAFLTITMIRLLTAG